jgi:hypothetical protein
MKQHYREKTMIINPVNMITIRPWLIAGMLSVTATHATAAPVPHTDKDSFDAALDGYGTLPIEDFEDDVWAASRFPLSTQSVTNPADGIRWTSNFAANNISTSDAGLEGTFALFSNPPGDPNVETDPAHCEVEDPIPSDCFLHDGFVGTSDGAGTLYGVGAWINGTSGAEVALFLDDVEVGFGTDGIISSWTFLGATDTEGFNTFEFREINGKGVQVLTIRADDVTIGVVPVPAAVWLFGSGLIGLVGISRKKKSA